MRLITGLLALLLISLPSVTLIRAGEPDFVRQSLRARGMGNAFTAVANDEMALFYNPAGLRSIHNNIYEIGKFSLINNTKLSSSVPFIGGHGSIDSDNINVSDGGIGALVGKNIYIESGLSFLSHVNSRWGYSLFNVFLVSAAMHNPVFPYLEGKLINQSGAVGAWAMSFMDYQLDVGFGGKIINRAGTDSDLHFTDEAIIGLTNNDTTAAREKFVSKSAISPDVGAIYHIERFHNLSPKIGIFVQNIGGMDFGGKNSGGTIPMVINTGVATESEFGPFDFIIAVDYHDLLDGHELASDNNMFTERNLKIGLEAGWWKLANGHHLFSFRIGRNGPYNSQGVTLNFWKLKLDFVKYSIETGGYAGEKEDKRWAFGAGLIF